MARPDAVVNLDAKFAGFDELWSPKIIAEINDLHLKAVKADGEFIWHSHDTTDEFFLVRSGRLIIQLKHRPDVTLGPGDVFVVPKGVEHRPVVLEPCEILLLEPIGVVNTGEVESSLASAGEWI